MTSSLRSRIRNGTLLLLALVIALGAYALPRLNSLGGTSIAFSYAARMAWRASGTQNAATTGKGVGKQTWKRTWQGRTPFSRAARKSR